MVLPALAAWIGVGVTYRKSWRGTDIVEANQGVKNPGTPVTIVGDYNNTVLFLLLRNFHLGIQKRHFIYVSIINS